MAEQATDGRIQCGSCKKPVKRAKRFYRNGNYYCNPNCWREAKKKLAEEAAEKAKEAAAAKPGKAPKAQEIPSDDSPKEEAPNEGG